MPLDSYLINNERLHRFSQFSVSAGGLHFDYPKQLWKPQGAPSLSYHTKGAIPHNSPPSSLQASWRPPMVMDLCLYLSELPRSPHIHALPSLLHHPELPTKPPAVDGDISPHGLMGWHSQKPVGMLPADKAPAQVHIAWLQGIFKAFALPFWGTRSKRMILWIVVVIFRNEDLVQWVLHRDQPRGEILSQKESCSGVKSPESVRVFCAEQGLSSGRGAGMNSSPEEHNLAWGFLFIQSHLPCLFPFRSNGSGDCRHMKVKVPSCRELPWSAGTWFRGRLGIAPRTFSVALNTAANDTFHSAGRKQNY